MMSYHALTLVISEEHASTPYWPCKCCMQGCVWWFVGACGLPTQTLLRLSTFVISNSPAANTERAKCAEVVYTYHFNTHKLAPCTMHRFWGVELKKNPYYLPVSYLFHPYSPSCVVFTVWYDLLHAARGKKIVYESFCSAGRFTILKSCVGHLPALYTFAHFSAAVFSSSLEACMTSDIMEMERTIVVCVG